jgi:hypothetical protein
VQSARLLGCVVAAFLVLAGQIPVSAATSDGYRCDVRVSRFTKGPVEIGGKRLRFYYSHWFQSAFGKTLAGESYKFPPELSFLRNRSASNLAEAKALCEETARRLKELTHARGMSAAVKPMKITR